MSSALCDVNVVVDRTIIIIRVSCIVNEHAHFFALLGTNHLRYYLRLKQNRREQVKAYTVFSCDLKTVVIQDCGTQALKGKA